MALALAPNDAGLNDLSDLVDLDRYPLHESGGARLQELVEDCRAQLATRGVATLPGLVQPDAVRRMAAETEAVIDRTYFCDSQHNAYLKAPDLDLPRTHPRNRDLATQVGSVAWDLIDPQATLRRLYLWDPLVAFVGAVLDRSPFFRFADPLGACSVNVFRPGMGHNWHFDEAKISTTLMLQKAEKGGDFEYVPFLRPERGEDFEAVGRILDGDETDVVRLPFEPGTLSIFHGSRSLHRVTRCGGKRDRLVAVLCFASEAGAVNSEAVRKLFWGRTR
ncbi:MAG: hypothetical protein SGJ07_06160 [Rhodospirillaceae bacterium]|nr:hypothetical protein [Rhodospirillaceae bacterium]